MIIDPNNIPSTLSTAAVKALCHLANVGATSASGLATVCGFSTAASTGLIDGLERKSLAMRSRSSADRRSVDIVITRRGREVVESMRPQPAEASTEEATA